MVVLGEGGDCCMLYLWKGRRADGARHVSVSGLDLVSDTPEGNAILDGILDYLADCNP